MKYYYNGVTRGKESVKGTIDATDEIEARLRLRLMQIRPTLVKIDKPTNIKFDLDKLGLGPKMDLKAMVVFTRQLSSLIDSGVPVVQCISILWEQEQRPHFKKVLLKIKEHIESGGTLSGAMEKYPKIFNDYFVRIVEAGEMSGTLDVSVRRVGIQLEKLGKLKSKVISALTYPVITLVVAIIVLVFMLLKVIPGVAQLYSDNSAKLPELTVFVLGLSKWVQDNFFNMIIVVAGMAVGIPYLFKNPKTKEKLDPLLLKLPLFGSLITRSTVATFSRTLSSLISSGVPLLQSFDICIRLIGNTALKKVLKDTQQGVAEGKTISYSLGKSTFFPPMVVHMVNIGEMTGKLDELLGKVAEIYDDEVDDIIGRMTGLLQPLLIVFVGGIVAFLLLAMYLPIFQLAEKTTGG